jgi:hypothetical protein
LPAIKVPVSPASRVNSVNKTKTKRTARVLGIDDGSLFHDAGQGGPAGFDPGLIAKMRSVAASGLTPSSALDLLGTLLAEVPSASEETMERIKTMDKLMNTARSMMETKLKNDEAEAILKRLDEIEERMERLAAQNPSAPQPPVEIWDNSSRSG